MNKSGIRRRNSFFAGLFGTLPDYVIIGVQKGGTGSLYNLLVQHPQIAEAATKEVTFFDRHYHKGALWYKAHFPTRSEKKESGQIAGEASPDYLYLEHAPIQAAKFIPQETKLIAVLRNPIDRAFSHYQHECRKGCEKLSFEDALENEEQRLLEGRDEYLNNNLKSFNVRHFSYKLRGIYVDQIKRWHEHFPKENLLIIKSEEFQKETGRILTQVHEFIGVKPLELENYPRYNEGKYSEAMKESTRDYLKDYFKPHNQRLSDYLARDFYWD